MLSDATIERLDWASIADQLNIEGYAMLSGLLDADAIRDLKRQTEVLSGAHRVPLASSDKGRGELFYFAAELPAPLRAWRPDLYRYLAVIANRWNDILGNGDRYPKALDDFLLRNRAAGQTRRQSHLSRLSAEDYLPLRQPHGGGQRFPLRIVALLSEPGAEFQGGEFVMVEQRPRMQSRPMVLPLKQGDAAIVGMGERPFKGGRGHYRVMLRHAIGRVRGGERIGLELTFDDAG